MSLFVFVCLCLCPCVCVCVCVPKWVQTAPGAVSGCFKPSEGDIWCGSQPPSGTCNDANHPITIQQNINKRMALAAFLP